MSTTSLGQTGSANAITINNANGNVGIGTTTPSTALQVAGTVTATGFAGPLTGNVTGNATGLSGTPNITVGTVTATSLSGALTGNVTGNVTGTATGLSGTPNITVGTVTTTGLTLQNSSLTGYVPTALLNYEEYTYSTTVTSIGGSGSLLSTNSVTFTFVRIGKSVTAFISGPSVAVSGTVNGFLCTVPARFKALTTSALNWTQREIDNTINLCLLYWDGTSFMWFYTISGGGFSGGGGTTFTFLPTSIAYITN